MAGIGPEVGASYDRPLQAERWPAHPDGPVILTFHDRDFALQPGFLDRLFAALPAGIETLSLNQYIGFLHTRIDSSAAKGWQLTFNFDEPYCAYFENHSSSWRLWLADPLLEKLRAMPEVNISIDKGSPAKMKAAGWLRQPLVIDIPAGVGRHVWKLGPVR
jgi:hypothetical protein